MMKILLLDMDGTITRFYENPGCLEQYKNDGSFFQNLRPYENLVKAINLIVETKGIRVVALSSVLEPELEDSIVLQKKNWISKWFGSSVESMFAVRQDKADVARKEFGNISDCYLLDDYSKNLMSFSEAGGHGIKAVNDVNCMGWNNINWVGDRIRNEDPVEQIVSDICSIMGI